jgi:hypothetical protein
MFVIADIVVAWIIYVGVVNLFEDPEPARR